MGEFQALRAKDLLSYLKAVRQLLAVSNKTLTDKENASDYHQKTKSYISSEETTLTVNKNQIKSSSVSRGCTIAAGSSLVDTIIYPNCVIRENCNLANCVVYSGTTLPKNCNLKDCVVGPHNSLQDGVLVTGENCVN